MGQFEYIKNKSRILYGKIIVENNKLSKYENGDRFFYVSKESLKPLSTTVIIAGHTCRVIHSSQAIICKRCSQNDHTVTDVEKCPGYIKEQNIVAFKYNDKVMSNMHPCKIDYKEMTFLSAEHIYQYEKC